MDASTSGRQAKDAGLGGRPRWPAFALEVAAVVLAALASSATLVHGGALMRVLKRLGLAGALAGSLAFAGCSTTNSMLGRNQQTWTLKALPDVPAAQGKVKVTTVKNGNRDVKVEVEHLALPAEVFQGTSTYVVWLTPEMACPRTSAF